MIEALLTKSGPLLMECWGGDSGGWVLTADIKLKIANPTAAEYMAMFEAGHISATLHLEVSE